MEVAIFRTLGLKSSLSKCCGLQNHDSSGDNEFCIPYLRGATKIGKYSMTREELDAALTGFAQDYSTDKMRFKVKVTNSKIVFESSYKVLGHPVPLYVYFTPVVSESGAIVLHVSELSAGTLKLPVSDALKMIKRSTNLPDYIAINSKKGKVTLNIQSMKNEKGDYSTCSKP